MSPYPTNWALLVKLIGQHKPYEMSFTELPDGLEWKTSKIPDATVPCVRLARTGMSGTMLRFEVVALLESLGYKPVADDEAEDGALLVRREMTTMAAEPISPVMVVQQLLRQHQPKRIFLIWYAGGARLELVSTLTTPLYRHSLGSREAAMKVDTYLRAQGWRIIDENLDARGGTEGDRQYER